MPAVPYGNVPTQRHAIEGRVVRRAWADPAYRARLLEDPKAALAEELGVELPEHLEVVVVEERPDRLCIVLPVDLSAIPKSAARIMIGEPPPPGSAY
ncbi:MAG TPA: NHLP leader peptide family RiPP precursor [Acidimicrobiales bacterium]|nr:NHLP leader peptide family RiPP precursor [Acidimicrobiales bacterium]